MYKTIRQMEALLTCMCGTANSMNSKYSQTTVKKGPWLAHHL